MNRKSTILRSRSWTIVFQFFAIIFLMQLLLITNPLNPYNLTRVSASPLTYDDSVWEGGNDSPKTPWDLGNSSIANNPGTPLNVSTLKPDYYKFKAHPFFYFSVTIEFNQTNVYNATGTNRSIIRITDFVADIDIEVTTPNGTIIGSYGNGNEEAVGPIYHGENVTGEYIINVTAVKYTYGYENIDYSTIYNMSVVFDDVWEVLQSNDKFDNLDDVYDGSSDDEIVPGVWDHLRFSGNNYTESGNEDWYIIWFYENTEVNMKVTSYVDNGTTETTTSNGPDFWVFNESFINLTLKDKYTVDYHKDTGGPSTENLAFSTTYSGWYFIYMNNTNFNQTDYYKLEIDIEDSFEDNAAGNANNVNASAKIIDYPFLDVYPGMVTSNGKDDWYRVEVNNSQRLMVDINWYSPNLYPIDFDLHLYNVSDGYINSSTLIESGSALNPIHWIGGKTLGERVGPIRPFNTTGDSTWLYIHVFRDNIDPRYYNLTIILEDIDDWAEDNDLFFNPYMLPAKSQVFEPTEADPWGGLFSLKGDYDWFAIPLIPGDFLTVRIEFNGSEGDLDMALYDGALNPLYTSVLSPSNDETVVLSVVHSDIYLFVIYGKSGSYATAGLEYNMTITVQEYDDSFESNDDANTAAPIAEGNFTDLILRDGDDDWFYLYLHETDVIEISLTYFAGTIEIYDEVYLNDIDLDLLNDDESLANQSRTLFNESLTFIAPVSGRYFILCVIDGSSNAYNLTINVIETDDLYEDNDVLSDSQLLNVTVNFNETISTIENNLWIRVLDDDYYHVNIPAGIAIVVEINFALTENLDLELLSSNGTLLDSSIQATGNFERVGPYPMNTTYYFLYNVPDIYFRVFMDSGLNAQYSINITVGPEALLITRENVPPFSSKPILTKKFDPFTVLIPLAVGGAIIGGGTAGGLYFAKKKGYLDKGINKFRDRFGRKPPEGGGETGGKTGGKTGGLKKIPP